MPTSTTLTTARALLVEKLDTGKLANNVYYAWPGPDVAKDRHELLWIDRVRDWTQQLPNMKAGRKQRQESYVFELVLWVAQPELTAAEASTCDDRAIELMDVIDDALAADVQLGETDIHWLLLTDRAHDLIPYETGWACQIVLSVEGQARLT